MRDDLVERALERLRDAQACFNGQHNLLSTATDEERRRVVENFLIWWNDSVVPLFVEMDDEEYFARPLQANECAYCRSVNHTTREHAAVLEQTWRQEWLKEVRKSQTREKYASWCDYKVEVAKGD